MINKTIVEHFVGKYGAGVMNQLNPDHKLFDLDLYMMWICRHIEAEMLTLETKQEKSRRDTMKAIEIILKEHKSPQSKALSDLLKGK